jgi:hypothetical protein
MTCTDGDRFRPVRLPVEPVGPLTTPAPASSTANPLATRWHRYPWLTPTVLSLAQAAYEERLQDGTLDPVRLAILADALEEVGADADLLVHLRSTPIHYPRCWALNLILGKE